MRHRGRPRVGTLLLLVLLVAAVVVVVIAATHNTTSKDDGTPGSTPSLVLGGTDIPSVSPSPSAVAPSPSVSPTDDTTAVIRGSAPLPAAYKTIPVSVYNTTTTQGLAAKVGARLTKIGWHVGTIASHPETLATTTVYYTPATKDAAFWMAANDVSITAAEPITSSVPVGDGGLVVLVAAGAS